MKRRDTPRPYVRIDNDLGADDKLLRVLDALFLAACGLHVLAIGFCDRKRTDGFLPRCAFRLLAPSVDEAIVAELVRVGCWEKRKREGEDGFEIHGYLEWQKSRAQIEELSAKRSAAAASSWPRTSSEDSKGQDSSTDASCSASCSATSYADTNTDTNTASHTLKDKPLSPEAARDQGHVDTSGLPDHVVGYWLDKLGRDPTAADVRSLKTLLKAFSAQTVLEAIGQACAQGERADNFALITTICRSGADA
ncbi:MAG: hypothetical protein U1E22_07475 [Coriobacteriia bacterium]|nr:hypothetical protein [Coriobacteriia bacterium]